MSSASLSQWLQRLETLHPREMELGLERVGSVAQALRLLPVRQPVVTVAGTNGKGSTIAVLEALLGETGKVVGAFTSPHFLRFNERIRVAGEEVGDEDIVVAFEAIDEARGEVSLTYFEFATLAALLVFRDRNPDVIMLEVGLGGRLDSVNIVDPTVAVITRIDLDHQAWLGNDRGNIAVEKAGILRRGTPAVIADSEPPDELLQRAAAVGAEPIICLGRDFSFETGADNAGLRLRLCGDGNEQRELSLELPGSFPTGSVPTGSLLPENICAALQAASLLGVGFSDKQAADAVCLARPRGRREALELAGINYLLDVAHNPAAVYKLLEYINATSCKGRVFAVFSVMADKDIPAMIEAAGTTFDAWFLADLPGVERAAQANDVARMLHQAGRSMISVSKNVRQAFRRAQSLLQEGDRLVVFGSFHTVAGVLPLLDKDRRKYS